MAPGDDGSDRADEPLKLDSLQRDILIPQIDAFLEATSDAEARRVYESLREAVAKLEIPAELQARLGAIVEVSLASGRVKRLFGPGADLALQALFQKTPRGREIARSIRELNDALAKLKGQDVLEASVKLRGPGAYSLTLKTAACEIVVRFEQTGVRVETLEIGEE